MWTVWDELGTYLTQLESISTTTILKTLTKRNTINIIH